MTLTMVMSGFYHLIHVERDCDGWYTIIYRVSDGLEKKMVVPENVFVSLYNLFGKALRTADPDKEENKWNMIVQDQEEEENKQLNIP